MRYLCWVDDTTEAPLSRYLSACLASVVVPQVPPKTPKSQWIIELKPRKDPPWVLRMTTTGWTGPAVDARVAARLGEFAPQAVTPYSE